MKINKKNKPSQSNFFSHCGTNNRIRFAQEIFDTDYSVQKNVKVALNARFTSYAFIPNNSSEEFLENGPSTKLIEVSCSAREWCESDFDELEKRRSLSVLSANAAVFNNKFSEKIN